MHGRWLSWLALSSALTAAVLVTLARPAIRHSEEVEEEQRGGLDQPDAAAWHDLQRRMPVDGREMPALYATATRQADALSRFASRINRVLPAAGAAARVWLSGSKIVASGERISATALLDTWTPLGPGNIGGRTRVIKFHPTVPTTLFAAGVSGGVWKSDDNGTTWRPSGDGLTNIAVNTLAISPQQPDVMFAGTGEGYFREEIRGTGLPLRGAGIFVTHDGGGSWQQLSATNTPDFQWVNDIELGVNDPQRLYAATRSGVWRSTDSGSTWAQMLTVSVRGGCLDLAMRPDRNEDVLFASCGSYDQGTVYGSRTPRPARMLKWCYAIPAWAAPRSRLRRHIRTSSMPLPPATSVVQAATIDRACSPSSAPAAAARSAAGKRASPTRMRAISTRCCSPTSTAPMQTPATHRT